MVGPKQIQEKLLFSSFVPYRQLFVYPFLFFLTLYTARFEDDSLFWQLEYYIFLPYQKCLI